MKLGIIALIVASLTVGCSDVVIKVNKKAKKDSGSTLSETEQEKNSGNLIAAEDFLKDLDQLKAVGFDLLMKQLKGQDFQTAVREAVRGFRAYLVTEGKKDRDPGLAVDEFTALACEGGKLDLNLDKAHKQLGMILKTAVLAKLSIEGTKAMNGGLEKEAAAIAQLLLNEIGLKVDGTSEVTKDGSVVTTTGQVSIKLVPFDSESQELQDRDANESIEMSFSRVAGENNTGSFNAEISASSTTDANGLEAYSMKLSVARSIKADGRSTYSTAMAIGKTGTDPHFIRRLSFDEQAERKIRVVDYASTNGTEAESAFIVDLAKLQECVLDRVEDEVTDEDKSDIEDDVSKVEEPTDDTSKDDSDGAKDDATGDEGSLPEPSETPSPTDTPEDDTDPGKVIDDSEDDNVVNDPGQSPSQNSPHQSAQK